MARTRKSSEIDSILKNWERRGMKEMTKGQRTSVKNFMLAMSQEELVRLVNDKKKPIYIVNIARGLLNGRAFDNQERIEERLDGKTITAELTGKDGKDLFQSDQRTLEDIESEIERLSKLDKSDTE